MPSFSGFAPFGLLTFDNAPSPAETAYGALRNAMGPLFSDDLTTYLGAKAFALAILVGVTRATIRRAYNQQVPLAVKDKIESLESDWGLVPGPLDDLNSRQLALSAQMLLMEGSKQSAIETALTAILGSSFYTLRITQPSERFKIPTTPTDQGTFNRLDEAPRYLTILDPVFVGPNTVRATPISGSSIPYVGEYLTVDPGNAARTERVLVTAVTPSEFVDVPFLLSFVAVSAHDPSTVAGTCLPMWRGNQRHVAVIVKAGSVTPELARKVNEVMARHMKSVTDWSIVAGTPVGLSGPWVVADAIIGETALGDTLG